MNKEKYNQIIELAWKKYADSHFTPGNPNGKLLSEQLASVIPMMHNRETFRKEIIKNPSFASQWGLKIEERELTFEERCEIYVKKLDGIHSNEKDIFIKHCTEDIKLIKMNENNIPTKLITITYSNETIEVFL